MMLSWIGAWTFARRRVIWLSNINVALMVTWSYNEIFAQPLQWMEHFNMELIFQLSASDECVYSSFSDYGFLITTAANYPFLPETDNMQHVYHFLRRYNSVIKICFPHLWVSVDLIWWMVAEVCFGYILGVGIGWCRKWKEEEGGTSKC